MNYSFYQIIISILIPLYFPVILTQLVFMFQTKKLKERIILGVTATIMIIGFPAILKNCQQYVMGYFSGLPEVAPKSLEIIATLLVVAIIAYIHMVIQVEKLNKELEAFSH